MNAKKVANGLGWFSIGLGLAQVLVPDRLGRFIGIGEKRGIMRALGAREIATGVAILAQQRGKVLGLWARVLGDVMDLSMLANTAARRSDGRLRMAGAGGMVLGVSLLDYLTARRETRL